MSTERVLSLKNIWFRASVGALIAIAVIAALIGFVWVPSARSDTGFRGIWDAICRAAGVAETARPTQQTIDAAARPSDVIVTPQMMIPRDRDSMGRGAAIATQCTSCHAASGQSVADMPPLAGQHDVAIYKQLRDFKSGHRASDVMAAFVQNLSDQDMKDVSAYYANLPRTGSQRPASSEQKTVPQIVQNGAPMRNIAPCQACHGDSDNKTGSPRLDGEPIAYVRAQLLAFATGARRNDIQAQMRNVARQLTPEETDASARYFSSR
jgi:cytochrome c553